MSTVAPRDRAAHESSEAVVRLLVSTTPMPPGYSLVVRPQRKYAHRSLWAVQVRRDGERVWGRAFYQPTHGIVQAQRWAWEQVR